MNKIIKGYDVFGKEYGYMNRHDPHDINSIEHKLMQEAILLDENSKRFLYSKDIKNYDMKSHKLYNYAQIYKKDSEKKSIEAVIKYLSEKAKSFNVDLADMYFGGTEEEILYRNTDWCFDASRLCCVLLDCIGIKSRIVFLANPNKAYYGHVVVECYYEKRWGLVDPIYGYIFYNKEPISCKNILDSHLLGDKDKDYKDMYLQKAIVEYNPMKKDNKYIISRCNEYTYMLNNMKQDGSWLLGEDK